MCAYVCVRVRVGLSLFSSQKNNSISSFFKKSTSFPLDGVGRRVTLPGPVASCQGVVPVVPGVPGLWQAGGWTGGISTARRGWVRVQFGWAPEPGAGVDASEAGPATVLGLGLVAASGVSKQLLPWPLLQPVDWAAVRLPVTWEAPWGRPGSPMETQTEMGIRDSNTRRPRPKALFQWSLHCRSMVHQWGTTHFLVVLQTDKVISQCAAMAKPSAALEELANHHYRLDWLVK